MNNISTTSDELRRPLYRYGMLLLILWLLASAVWRFVRVSDEGRFGGGGQLVVVSLLLVNHLVASFLPPERQRMMRIPQFLFLGFGVLYVFGLALGVIQE